MIELDINKLYKAAFGIRGIPASQIKSTSIYEAEELDASKIKSPGASTLLYDSRLVRKTPIGTALFMPMMIGGIQLPNEPMMIANIKKKIIETPLYGSKRRGGVIEDMGIESYVITIKGVAVNYNDSINYPSDQVDQLNRLFMKREALEIVCPLTELLGIEYVVLKSLSWPEMVGVQHAQAYQFQAVEDHVFELEEK